ncbi:MAG: phytanoyl-CoA dioxygenase family protein [Planctomycetota bacterium]|nr:phytanoyl-CoA dioxygenase family protein [Planctomycetota bacterium]
MLDSAQLQAYDRDGYLRVRGLFSRPEVGVLLDGVEHALAATRRIGDMPDAAGRSSKLALWMDVREDVFGAATRHPRLVGAARQLLREDVYHWHSKVMLKEPRVGGAWEWHQDYGYWYRDGCLYPRLVSCMLALDPATPANGCLQVMPGSHLLGRIEHGRSGNQSGADPERVAAAQARLQTVHAEMDPGDVLFFHANTLHASGPNASDAPRRAYICCYNALSNRPFGGKGHGNPEPIALVPDDAILAFARAEA